MVVAGKLFSGQLIVKGDENGGYEILDMDEIPLERIAVGVAKQRLPVPHHLPACGLVGAGPPLGDSGSKAAPPLSLGSLRPWRPRLIRAGCDR